MASFAPREILGNWRKGFALDLHTISSEFIGHDEFGRPQFDTKRSELGELLYRLKYNRDASVVPEIVSAALQFIKSLRQPLDAIVPVPPSTQRDSQPVLILAQALSQSLGAPMRACVTRVRDIPQLKNVNDLDERMKLLEGLHKIDPGAVEGKRILLFDDLYRSGATMNSITAELFAAGKAADVFALTITRTRSNL